ncbi:hypothetical protein pdam_00011245 [Pocillopora damicornis]|uniref:F-BAR domain-containing protein n=1 Tax=Pocillopora damicornis TaxID=46731 RepID=A0A3M6U6Q7_POCDA|nr:hypothetical protein pdam_00011245 [Pocillopora damicornis]
MTVEGQHLRFSVDLPFKGGHEAIVNHIESELKHLEHVKEYLNKRAKVELEYALALTRINTTASKVITDSDKESPVRKEIPKKDLLQDVVNLTNCCREEFLSSSRVIQTSVNEVRKQQEYSTFITKFRQDPSPVIPFLFDPNVLELTSTGVTAEELVVNDLTYEKLQHKRALLSKDLENVDQQLESKKEQTVSVLNWNVEDIKCSQAKLQKTCTQIAAALDKLGKSQPPKFADLSPPGSSPTGEFGQSTPEIRKSGRKIPTLFKKRKLEREASSAKTSNKPVRYGTAPPGVNGGSYEDDSDNSAQGEYIEEARDKIENGYRMPAPQDTPSAVYQIMKDCWNLSADGRPRFTEILRRLKQIQDYI